MVGTLRRVAFVAFFLSGASSLVFQTLWSRLLSHVFGSSSIAISSVVSVFMAGLGLGAWLFGRRADRIRDPLLVYALAEVGVGCSALLVPLLVRPDGMLAAINAALRNSLGTESMQFMLLRFLCIVPILLVPTVLMGSTLPLLSRYFVAQQSSPALASAEVGRLYAVNTAGAILGVVAGSFVLLPRFGVQAANVAAACTNFSLALMVGLMRWRARVAPPPSAALQPVLAQPEQPSTPAFSAPVRRAAALAFACSGFASLLYEIVWSRALINTIGGSMYSFALILTTFLVGIALGSAGGSSLTADGSRVVGPTASGAAVLCCIAVGPVVEHFGLWPGVGCAAAGCAVLVLWFASTRARAGQLQLLDASAQQQFERTVALRMLVVPALVVAAAGAAHPDRLARVTACVVLLGCALMALLLWLARRPLWLLCGLQLFIAAATFTSDLIADELSLTFAGMVAPLYDRLPQQVGTVQVLMCVTAALCVLPSALGMGAVFPITLRVWSSGGAQIGDDVGTVYAGNTLGSIVGAWLPGFVLMPSFGMQATLHIGIATNLLVAFGLVLVMAYDQRGRSVVPSAAQRRSVSLLAMLLPWLVALLAFVSLRPPEMLAWNISKMTLGAFRISLARDVLDEESWGAPDLVYYHDGLSTTVTVERWGRHFSLKNNGKVDASNGDDMPTQIMVAALPLLMHRAGPQNLDVAIVGFGSGVTVGAALQFPLRSVQVMELERSIVEASRFFADVNHLDYVLPRFPYVRTPRLTVINDDGRNYLAATASRFDVIVSEPSNPWLTGVSDLFTVDHFRIAKRKLKPGGIYCQWAQLYEISPENVKTIYRTFASLFRHVVVFSAEDLSSDTVLLGSDDPLPLDLARLRRAFAMPGVASELERAYVHSPYDVFARVLLANESELRKFTAGAVLNTDDNARIELSAPRDLIGFERYKGYLQTMYAPNWPYARIAPRLTGFGTGDEAAENDAQQALALLAHGRKSQSSLLLTAATQAGNGPSLQLTRAIHDGLLGVQDEPGCSFAAEAVPADAPQKLREPLRTAWAAVQAALARHSYKQALAALERVPEHLRRDLGADWALAEGFVLYKVDDSETAIELLEGVVRSEPAFAAAHPELYYFLARSHDALMHFDKAVRNMRAYVEAAHPPAGGSQDMPFANAH